MSGFAYSGVDICACISSFIYRTLPKYVNLFTSFIYVSPNIVGVFDLLLMRMVYVLSVVINRPYFAASTCKFRIFVVSLCRIALSDRYHHWSPSLFPSPVFIIQLIAKMKINGDSKHPCRHRKLGWEFTSMNIFTLEIFI